MKDALIIMNKEWKYLSYYYKDLLWAVVFITGLNGLILLKKSPLMPFDSMVEVFFMAIPVITTIQFVQRSLEEEKQQKMLEYLMSFGISKVGFVIGKIALPLLLSVFSLILAYLEFSFILLPVIKLSGIRLIEISLLSVFISGYAACINVLFFLLVRKNENVLFLSMGTIVITASTIVVLMHSFYSHLQLIISMAMFTGLSLLVLYLCALCLESKRVFETI